MPRLSSSLKQMPIFWHAPNIVFCLVIMIFCLRLHADVIINAFNHTHTINNFVLTTLFRRFFFVEMATPTSTSTPPPPSAAVLAQNAAVLALVQIHYVNEYDKQQSMFNVRSTPKVISSLVSDGAAAQVAELEQILIFDFFVHQ